MYLGNDPDVVPQIKFMWHKVDRQIAVMDWRKTNVIKQDWYPGRNYDEFAILADVRNGSGFAGVDTGDLYEPIAAPKGIPDDCSDEVLDDYEGWGADAHSASWLTLKELKATPQYWSKTVKKRGMITKAQAQHLEETGEKPTSWSGGVWGAGAENYVQYEWEIEYRDHAGYLLKHLIPALEDLISCYGLHLGMVPTEVHRVWNQASVEGYEPHEPDEDLPDNDDGTPVTVPGKEKPNRFVLTDEDIRIVMFFDN